MFIIGILLVISWLPLAFIITADKAIWSFVVGIILIVISSVNLKAKSEEKFQNTKEKLEKKLVDLNDFKVSQKIFLSNGNSLLAIDDENKKLCLIRDNGMPLDIYDFKVSKNDLFDNDASMLAIDNENKKLCIIQNGLSVNIYSYKSILQTEIIEDGNSVTKTSRGSQIGGALIGGVLAGGVGAIIGGLSGSQKTSQEVKKLQLQIVINDTQIPVKELTFLDSFSPIKKDNPKYKVAYEKVNHWHKVISVIIKQVDEEEKQNERNNLKENLLTYNSIADEIKKLAELRNGGILTEEEFNQQKIKLLS
jgi:hypothetical protein